MNTGNTVKEIFGNLPDEQELQKQPLEISSTSTNLHVHLPPNFGSIKSIDEAVSHAQEENISVLGASNYYDHTIYTAFARAAVNAGIAPVFGIEVLTMDEALQKAGTLTNDPKNPGKLYLCGKGLTSFDNIASESLPVWTQIREGDKQRIKEMIEKLNRIELLQQNGIQLQYDAIAQTIAEEKKVAVETVFLQERHLAQALQQAVFEKIAESERETFLRQLYQIYGDVTIENLVKVQGELRTHLLKQGKVAYVDECFVSPEDAAQLIIGLGGYVSYPTLADGAPSISPFEGPPEVLVEHLLKRQIPAAEFIPTRNDLGTLTTYVKTLRAHGIVIGAGTEHNDATWLPLLPHCKQNTPLSDELVEIFWEGACVAVAHQYLCAKGQGGFRFLDDVDSRNGLIQKMAELGAYVINALR